MQVTSPIVHWTGPEKSEMIEERQAALEALYTATHLFACVSPIESEYTPRPEAWIIAKAAHDKHLAALRDILKKLEVEIEDISGQKLNWDDLKHPSSHGLGHQKHR